MTPVPDPMQVLLHDLMQMHKPNYECGCAVVPCAECDKPYPCLTLRVVRTHLMASRAATHAAQSSLLP